MSSIASAAHDRSAIKLRGLDKSFATACFAAAGLAGLVGAFVGLDTFGFWFDELFTVRILEPAPGSSGLLARIVTDVHPPVYPVLLYLYAKIAGDSDTALRGFSALSACAAILVFVASTGTTFSPRGRLFGAALATGSLFWFFQSQDARSYALCLLVSAGILALALSLVVERTENRRARLSALFALMLVGSFTHFYVLYESLAVLIVLFLPRRQDRTVLVGMAVVLALAAALYVKLVMGTFSRASLDTNWYANDFGWYVRVLQSSWQYTFSGAGGIALLLCAVAAVFGRRWREMDAVALSPTWMLVGGVPLLVLLGAIVSSTLLSPNFFDRNFLVISPFFWALAAGLYDAATTGVPHRIRWVVNASLAVLVLSMASIALQRAPAQRPTVLYEPFRESAAWVRGQPQCRDEIAPVITTDRRAWYKAGFAEGLYGSIYGRYLDGFAWPRLIFAEDLAHQRMDAELADELRRRLDGQGCPILAWSVHNIGPMTFARITRDLLQTIGRAPPANALKVQEFHQGLTGYALYRGR